MRRFSLLIAAAAFLWVGAANIALADTVQSGTLEFASGAVWNGTITFNDAFGMIGANGLLNGGSYGFTDEPFTWTWWATQEEGNPFDSDGDGLANDWVMNGTDSSNYTMIIGLSWNAAKAVQNNGVAFSLLNDSSYSGIQGDYVAVGAESVRVDDLLVSSTFSPAGGPSTVPEPASLLLLGTGLGMIGMAARRRRK